MCPWRLVKPEVRDAFFNMAVDEAIMQARIEERAPNTLRLYRWCPSAVSIGRFQNIYDEVNLENCKIHGVDVVRRISGGGAVYHDTEDEITYSVIVKRKDLRTDDVVEAYRYICNGLIEAARILGVNAEYDGGNVKQCPNITVETRKISGSAQANRRGVILQHGTLLMNVDLEKMFTFLNVPRKDAYVDLVSIAKRKITSVADELDIRVRSDDVYEALIKGFGKSLGIELVENVLTDHELQLARRLKEQKFATREWNFGGKIDKLAIKPVG